MADDAASNDKEQQDGRAVNQQPEPRPGDDQNNHTGTMSALILQLLAR